MLPLSHDEVVHGKGSLLRKMPGDRWQQLANLRALYAYMWAHPGKKLLFMGGEIAQEREWNHDRSLDWHLLESPEHGGVQALVRELNRIYRGEPALWEVDFAPDGFPLARRKRRGRERARLRPSVPRRQAHRRLRLQPLARPALRLPRRPAAPGRWREALNTDSAYYGGSDVGNLGGVEADAGDWHGQPCSAEVTLPPLGAVWLVPEEQAPASPSAPG